MSRRIKVFLVVSCPKHERRIKYTVCKICEHNEYVAVTQYAVICGWKK